MKKALSIVLALTLVVAFGAIAYADGVADVTNEYKTLVTDMAVKIVTMIFTIVFGYVGLAVKSLYKKYVNTDSKKKIAQDVVEFVEQVYTDIHGADKLHKAMERMAALLADKGIQVTTTEMETALEAAVFEMNNKIKE